jgi:hypothetical protein
MRPASSESAIEWPPSAAAPRSWRILGAQGRRDDPTDQASTADAGEDGVGGEVGELKRHRTLAGDHPGVVIGVHVLRALGLSDLQAALIGGLVVDAVPDELRAESGDRLGLARVDALGHHHRCGPPKGARRPGHG